MSYLQGRGIHVDKHLTNVAINYRPSGFIGDQVFPIVPVGKQTDMIKTYNQADLFRVENTRRSPGARANKVSFQVGSTAYNCLNYAQAADVTIEDRANADATFIRDLEEGRTMFVTDKLSLDWENRIAAQATNTSNVGTSAAVGSAWTDLTNSDPLTDTLTMIDNIESSTGYKPNRVLFGGDAWRYFARNNTIIDKVNQTGVTGGGQFASQDQAASLLQVEKVLVGNAYRNTAEEGIGQTLSRMWGDHVLIYFAPDRPSIELPSFGYTLRWNAAGLANMTVERHPFDTHTKTDEIEVGYYQDELITASALGALVTNVTSST